MTVAVREVAVRRGPRRLSRPVAVWCAWTAASGLGLFLGVRVFFGLLEGFTLPVPRGPWSDTVDVAALGGGALVGACQALVLGPRLRVPGALGWVAATAAGAAFALAAARGGDGLLRLVGAGALFHAVDASVWRVVALALLGAAPGFAQWLVLRRRAARAWWWVPTSAAGTLATAFVLATLPPEAGGLGWLALAPFGAVTGAVLVCMLPAGKQPARG